MKSFKNFINEATQKIRDLSDERLRQILRDKNADEAAKASAHQELIRRKKAKEHNDDHDDWREKNAAQRIGRQNSAFVDKRK